MGVSARSPSSALSYHFFWLGEFPYQHRLHKKVGSFPFPTWVGVCHLKDPLKMVVVLGFPFNRVVFFFGVSPKTTTKQGTNSKKRHPRGLIWFGAGFRGILIGELGLEILQFHLIMVRFRITCFDFNGRQPLGFLLARVCLSSPQD